MLTITELTDDIFKQARKFHDRSGLVVKMSECTRSAAACLLFRRPGGGPPQTIDGYPIVIDNSLPLNSVRVVKEEGKMQDSSAPVTDKSNPHPAPQVNVDPLAELITDLHDRLCRLEKTTGEQWSALDLECASLRGRIEALEADRRVTNSLIRTLAGECGYKLRLTKQGGGKVKAEWEKTSGLVTL